MKTTNIVIEDILSTLRGLIFILENCRMKKKGRRKKGFSPFHSNTSPSNNLTSIFLFSFLFFLTHSSFLILPPNQQFLTLLCSFAPIYRIWSPIPSYSICSPSPYTIYFLSNLEITLRIACQKVIELVYWNIAKFQLQIRPWPLTSKSIRVLL